MCEAVLNRLPVRQWWGTSLPFLSSSSCSTECDTVAGLHAGLRHRQTPLFLCDAASHALSATRSVTCRRMSPCSWLQSQSCFCSLDILQTRTERRRWPLGRSTTWLCSLCMVQDPEADCSLQLKDKKSESAVIILLSAAYWHFGSEVTHSSGLDWEICFHSNSDHCFSVCIPFFSSKPKVG